MLASPVLFHEPSGGHRENQFFLLNETVVYFGRLFWKVCAGLGLPTPKFYGRFARKLAVGHLLNSHRGNLILLAPTDLPKWFTQTASTSWESGGMLHWGLLKIRNTCRVRTTSRQFPEDMLEYLRRSKFSSYQNVLQVLAPEIIVVVAFDWILSESNYKVPFRNCKTFLLRPVQSWR